MSNIEFRIGNDHDAEDYLRQITFEADALDLFTEHCYKIPNDFYKNAVTATWKRILQQPFGNSLGWSIAAPAPDSKNVQHFKLKSRPHLYATNLPVKVSHDLVKKFTDGKDFSNDPMALMLRQKAEEHAENRNRMLFRPSYFPFRGLNDKESSDGEILNGLGIKVSDLVGDDQAAKRDDMRKQVIVTHEALRSHIELGDCFHLQIYDNSDDKVRQVKPDKAWSNIETDLVHSGKSFPIGAVYHQNGFCYIRFAKRFSANRRLNAVKSGAPIEHSHGGYAYVAKRFSSHSIDDIVSSTTTKSCAPLNGGYEVFKFTPNLYEVYESVNGLDNNLRAFPEYTGKRSAENGLGGVTLPVNSSAGGVRESLVEVIKRSSSGDKKIIVHNTVKINVEGHKNIVVVRDCDIPQQVALDDFNSKTGVSFKSYAPPIYVLDSNPGVLSIQMWADAHVYTDDFLCLNKTVRRGAIISCYELASRVMHRHVKIENIPY